MFEVGQCATPVLVLAMRAISSAEMNTAWANQTSSPNHPNSSA